MSAEQKLEIQYTEVSAESVVKFFIGSYTQKPEHYEWFYDSAKQKFVFRLYVRATTHEVKP